MALSILIGAGFGLLAGNVLARIYSAWPQGRHLSFSRPTCQTCLLAVRPRWAVPVIWSLRQRGSCGNCKAPVDPALPVIELLAAAIGALAAAWTAEPLNAIAAALLGWQLLLLGALDLRHRWLPDPLSLALALSGLGLAAAFSLADSADLLLGMALGFGSLELVRRGYRQLRGREGLGGGDPKLFAAIGCWVGWQGLSWVLLTAALGGLAAVAGLAIAGRRSDTATRLPLGTMLACAAWPIWLLTRPV